MASPLGGSVNGGQSPHCESDYPNPVGLGRNRWLPAGRYLRREVWAPAGFLRFVSIFAGVVRVLVPIRRRIQHGVSRAGDAGRRHYRGILWLAAAVPAGI